MENALFVKEQVTMATIRTKGVSWLHDTPFITNIF